MPRRIKVPQVSANVNDVTVTQWLKAVGESVSTGEPVVEVTTDKAAFEIESPADGVLLQQLAPVKSVVPIDYCVGIVSADQITDTEVDADNARIMQAYRDQAAMQENDAEPARTRRSAKKKRVRATPRARRLARAAGIDLDQVKKETGAPTITEAVLAPYLQT